MDQKNKETGSEASARNGELTIRADGMSATLTSPQDYAALRGELRALSEVNNVLGGFQYLRGGNNDADSVVSISHPVLINVLENSGKYTVTREQPAEKVAAASR